jgi:hypothetical protein
MALVRVSRLKAKIQGWELLRKLKRVCCATLLADARASGHARKKLTVGTMININGLAMRIMLRMYHV